MIDPLQQLLAAMPKAFGSMGCISRIQEFLRKEPRVEQRLVGFSSNPSVSSRSQQQSGGDSEVELGDLTSPSRTNRTTNDHSIILRDCNFGWDAASLSVTAPVTATLGDRTTGSLIMIVGPVGSGKSTFLKALIGETSVIRGDLRVKSSRIAYCDQTSWITNGTIRENIIAESNFVDEDWYTSVIHACDLDTDLRQLSRGDATVVGSKGSNLSGGQKQRIVGPALSITHH